MICPRCDQPAYWKYGDAPNVILLFDKQAEEVVVVSKTDRYKIVEITEGFTFMEHECNALQYANMTEDDLRLEFWGHAKIVGMLYACPVCNVGAQQPCMDMRYTVKEHPTEWPHKERFIGQVDMDMIANAKERGWLS